MTRDNSPLQSILDSAVDNNKVFGTSFCLRYKDFIWGGASGNLNPQSQYFITSATKMFLSALVLNFKYNQLIDLDDKISKFLSKESLRGLHCIDDRDYSNDITIRHLLSHTSGIPDYMSHKAGGQTMLERMTKGEDQYWIYEKAIQWSKDLKPAFPPGASGRILYSDTNFQLLGRIIENITNRSLAENYDKLIFKTAGLTRTYLFRDFNDENPELFYFENRKLRIPKSMASFGPDGGVVSTSGDLLLFIEAFFNGTFFPRIWISSLKCWNKIYPILYVGTGIQRIKVPLILDPMNKIPEMMGYAGLSGTVMFCNPEKDLYITGTVNQLSFSNPVYGTMFKLLKQLRRMSSAVLS
jgi:D-alanyl-D-alanine carboxypeptidase